MARSLKFLLMSAAVVCFAILPAMAQRMPAHGRIMIPKSSQAQPGDAGKIAHTDLEIFMPDNGQPLVGPPASGFAFETPASLACVYGLAPRVRGCNPNVVTANPTGG